MTKKFFLLEIFDMNTSREIKLYFEFDWMDVQLCNFNMNGELILFCEIVSHARENDINLVCVYSIETTYNNLKQTKTTKCQKIYMIPKEAKLISITKYNKIWLFLNNILYEWDLLTAYTTMSFNSVYEVIIKILK